MAHRLRVSWIFGNAKFQHLDRGRAYVGCNWQTGNWVLGVEGDADAQHWRRSDVVGAVIPVLFVPGDRFDLTSHWQASVRGRVGYAWDRNLFYVTGGVAFTDVNATTNWIAIGGFPGVLTSQTKDLVGGTVGAGFGARFANNFTVGVEGRYTWYGNQTFGAGLLPTIGFPRWPVHFLADHPECQCADG